MNKKDTVKILVVLIACGIIAAMMVVAIVFQLRLLKIPVDQSNDELYSRIEQMMDEKLSSK